MPSCRWVFQCSTQPRRGMAQRDGSLAPCRTDSNRLNGNGGHLPALPASQGPISWEGLGTLLCGLVGLVALSL